jgi:transposase
MKHEMLQMLVSGTENLKKEKLLIDLIIKFIKKTIGTQKRGKKRIGLYKVICGILYYLKTGCQWRCLPQVFGKWRTVYGWYAKLCEHECFKKLWIELIKYADSKRLLSLKDILCDGSLVLTTSSISIKKKNPRVKNKNCINRLILTDKNGLPIALLLAPGTAHDTNFLIPLVDQAQEQIKLPKNFCAHADKGFDSVRNRWQISLRGGKSEIPVRNHGFTIAYPKIRDSIRPIVEHAFAWINSFKALKTISTKRLENLYENTFLIFSTIIARFLKLKDIKTMIRTT